MARGEVPCPGEGNRIRWCDREMLREAPLRTRLDTDSRVYANAGTAKTFSKTKKLCVPSASVRISGNLPTQVAGMRVPSAVMKTLADA